MNFEKLGPYKIGRQLGRGGMGTVFVGEHEETGELVAVKVLAPALAADEGFRERFKQEIDTLIGLNHENIARLLGGFGEDQGTHFYTMELVEGTSLEQELRLGRKFTWEEATKIGVQMCKALKHASDRGVIHRDIKPANILMTPEKTIKLSDFGIARLFRSAGMTMAGGVIGTAEFMAPEQASGRPVSQRSDLYSLGGVLYALIAGRPPFVSKSIVEVLQMQRFSAPEPLRRYDPDVPREFEEIVMQLLAKDPDERVKNAGVLTRLLEATAHGLTKRAATKDNDHDFEITPAADTPSPRNLDPGATSQPEETRFSTGSGKQGQSVDLMAATRQTGSSGDAVTRASVVASGADPESDGRPATRFVPVAEEDLDKDLLSSDQPARNWPLIIVLAAGLVGIIATVWWFMQPASADDLFEQITTAAADGSDESLAEVEDQMREFVDNYPNDERAEMVNTYLENLQLHADARDYRAALRKMNPDRLLPVQRLFLQATDRRLSQVEQAARLGALVALFNQNGTPEENERIAKCVNVARNYLERIEQESRQYAGDVDRISRFLSNARDQRATALAMPDGPERERLMAKSAATLHGLVTLYSAEYWARDYVAEAHELLDTIDASGVSSNGN